MGSTPCPPRVRWGTGSFSLITPGGVTPRVTGSEKATQWVGKRGTDPWQLRQRRGWSEAGGCYPPGVLGHPANAGRQ